MRTHTSTFKDEIKKLGREIKGKIIYYNNYNLITESGDNILTEGDMQLITEQANYSESQQINESDIFSIEIIKNGNLLQSLMKQFNFEAKIELNLGTVVNPQFGLLVDKEEQEYEYLDYGNYYIYSKEYNVDMNTWSYVCYDKILFAMIKYKKLSNVTYPLTIKQFINKLCNKVGLEFEDSNFVNQNQLIYEDIYKDKNVTIRDIFDDISKIAGGNLLINDNDKLEIGYPTTTNDTIDDNYLKDINVKLNQKIGPINSVAIYDTDNDLQYIAEDNTSIKQYGLTRITITDNLLAWNGETQTIANNIFNQLKNLIYYENDFTTTGVCYYDFLDLFNVEARGVIYQCLLLNNEITINQGIEEHIFTEQFEELETKSNEYTTSVMTNKQATFKINQQEGKIESRVEKDGVISAINQSAEEIQIEANKISLEGKEINLTSDNIVIESTNFSVDEDGNLVCNDATMNDATMNDTTMNSATINDVTANNLNINGGRINLTASSNSDQRFVMQYNTYKNALSPKGMIVYNNNNNNYYAYYEATGFNATSSDGVYQLSNYATAITLYKNNSSTINLNGSSGEITCVSLTQTSKAESKKNFEKLTNAKDILNQVDIYKYNFKDEDDNVKKSIGFVIGDDFNYSQEITSQNNDGANIYSMVSVLWQVVKEQQEEIKELKEMIKSGKY